MRRVRLTPEAESDIHDGYVWYREISENLGASFLDELEGLFDRVEAAPLQYPEIAEGVRKAAPRIFPYLVFHTAEDDGVVVLAIIHGRLDPDYIASRLLV